jgi:phospho-N-acetylmuramoyl-pentapeptide-transferase
MLYYFFDYLHSLHFPGAGLFQYISFRAAMAAILALAFSLVYGKKLILFLQKKQIGETIRDLGLEGQYAKKGTPTMGGVIIIGAILIPTLLLAKLENVYVLLMLFTTIWLGLIGGIDDYIKVFKKDKEGLSGRFKILGQVTLGLVVGLTLYFSDTAVVRKVYLVDKNQKRTETLKIVSQKGELVQSGKYVTKDVKSTKTTIPFIKNHEFDYAWLIGFLGNKAAKKFAWIVFVLVVIVIITAVSNGANITDGLDGLAAGSSAIIGVTLAFLAYVSGNIIYSNYLNIMYIPHTGELLVFGAAFVGATIGFLWYNSFPAQVFMGDTGSLMLGGIIAVFAIIIRKELLIPVLCGIFLVENLSVMMQVSYFKYTKKKYGEGRRIFKMAPLHHHFQKSGYAEPKIVNRFWIVGILLAIVTIIITLKIR